MSFSVALCNSQNRVFLKYSYKAHFMHPYFETFAKTSLKQPFSYLTSRIGYGEFSMWELRIMAFSSSYVTFPLLTWKFFGEPITDPKTIVSTAIASLLIIVQVLWK